MKRYSKIWITFMVILLAFQGCNIQKKLIDATDNVTKRLKTDSKSIGDSLMLGLTNRLTMAIKDSLGTSLNNTIKNAIEEASFKADNALKKIGKTTNEQTVAIRDSIFGEVLTKRLQKLRDDLLGKKTKGKLDTLVMSAFNQIPKNLLADILHNGVLKLTEDSIYLKKLSKSIIGPETAFAVQMVVDSAMNTLVRRYNKDLSPTIRGELGFFQKYATQLLWSMVAGIVAIIAFVWWKRRKYITELEQLRKQQNGQNQFDQDNLVDLIVSRLTTPNQNGQLEPLLQQLLKLQNKQSPNS